MNDNLFLLVIPTQVIIHSFVFIMSILSIYKIYTIQHISPFVNTMQGKTAEECNLFDLLFVFDLYRQIFL